MTLPEWPHPLLMAGLIQQAEAVIGPSFHLAITALTAGVPVFSPVDLSLWKYSGLLGFETIHPLPGEDSEPDWFFSRLGRTTVSPRVGAAVDRLAGHWDRIATVLQGGNTCTSVKVGRFWQSLPDLLETEALRHKAEIVELETGIAARERRIAERERRIAERERRIADLEESTSWKVTGYGAMSSGWTSACGEGA